MKFKTLKNISARLITVVGDDGQEYRILPGDNPSVEVPVELCEKFFIKALIKEKILAVVIDGEVDEVKPVGNKKQISE